MLPRKYRKRYFLIFFLSLLVHLLAMLYLLLNPVTEEKSPSKAKTVEIKLKQKTEAEKAEAEKEEADKKKAEESPKKEEPKKEEPKKEEPKKEKPKKEEPKKEEPKKQEPKKQEPKKQEPKKQELKKQEPKKQEPKKQEPKKQEPKKEKPKKGKPKQVEPKKPPPKSDASKDKPSTDPDPRSAEYWMKKQGSMEQLDDKALKRTIIQSRGFGQNFQDRQQQGKIAYDSLNIVERQEFNAYLQKGANMILANYIAPKKDGKKYRGEISILIDEEGYITNVTFKTSSGNVALDDAMLKAVLATPRLVLPPNPEVAFAMYTRPLTLWYTHEDMAD